MTEDSGHGTNDTEDVEIEGQIVRKINTSLLLLIINPRSMLTLYGTLALASAFPVERIP